MNHLIYHKTLIKLSSSSSKMTKEYETHDNLYSLSFQIIVPG
jgi:hypothetical protein